MRNLIFCTLFAFMLAFVANAAEPKPGDWLNEIEDILAFQKSAQQLADTNFFEVRVTRLMMAVDRLKEKSVVPLTEDLARYYVGPLYKTKEGTKPYLVRGLFANYTGGHTLYWRDGRLLIRHDSLGRFFHPQFSPLVVNVSAKPKEVFIYVGGAQ